MGIVELLTKIGDERIAFQNLDTCTIRTDWSRKIGSKITFGTEEPIDPATAATERVGLVVWLPRDLVEKIIAEAKGAEGGEDA